MRKLSILTLAVFAVLFAACATSQSTPQAPVDGETISTVVTLAPSTTQTPESPTPEEAIEGEAKPYTLCAGSLCITPEVEDIVYGEIVSVTDGDTLDVLLDGEVYRVRLIGVNTPESDECYAREATGELALMLETGDGTVELVKAKGVDDEDSYGRLLRYVGLSNGTVFVNYNLITSGAADAVEYQSHPGSTAFANAADSARSQRVGRWSAQCVADESLSAVKIVEMHADAQGNDNENLTDEWVEITASETVDLTGWTLADASSSHRFIFPEITLAAGESIKIITGCGNTTDSELFWCSRGAVWNNSGDRASLRNADGIEVSSLAY